MLLAFNSDGSTVEHIVYLGGDNVVTEEHMKITGGDLTQPGQNYIFPGTNLDINASMEIWQFFYNFDINCTIKTMSFNEFYN